MISRLFCCFAVASLVQSCLTRFVCIHKFKTLFADANPALANLPAAKMADRQTKQILIVCLGAVQVGIKVQILFLDFLLQFYLKVQHQVCLRCIISFLPSFPSLYFHFRQSLLLLFFFSCTFCHSEALQYYFFCLVFEILR